MKKTIGIIGPGEHFKNKIYPILKKSNFFKITGILRNKKKNFNSIKYFKENDFFNKKHDFIYISCPNKLHEKYIIKSLKSHSHVICEKPFVISNKKIKKILFLSERNKKLIFESFMYVYHPAFVKLKQIIKNPKLGKLKYVISNFKFPSLKKNNQRYIVSKGNGFFYDSAVYPISLENFLFENYKIKKSEIYLQKIKKKVDLRGSIFVNCKNFKIYYFCGDGQNYSNNIELVFEYGTIFFNKIFSKKNNENIEIKIFFKNSLKKINFKKLNHFKIMFNKIKMNYLKQSFQKFHRKKINNQVTLVNMFNN